MLVFGVLPMSWLLLIPNYSNCVFSCFLARPRHHILSVRVCMWGSCVSAAVVIRLAHEMLRASNTKKSAAKELEPNEWTFVVV